MSRLPRIVAVALLLSTPACLFETKHDDDPLRRPAVFEFLLAPREIPAGEVAALEAGLFVGSSGCWSVEFAEVVLDGDVLRARAGSVNPNDPHQGCTDASVHATVVLDLPPLAPGDYFIEADSIRLPIRCVEAVGSDRQQFVGIEHVSPLEGCASICPGNSRIVLTELPPGLASGDYRIEGHRRQGSELR